MTTNLSVIDPACRITTVCLTKIKTYWSKNTSHRFTDFFPPQVLSLSLNVVLCEQRIRDLPHPGVGATSTKMLRICATTLPSITATSQSKIPMLFKNWRVITCQVVLSKNMTHRIKPLPAFLSTLQRQSQRTAPGQPDHGSFPSPSIRLAQNFQSTASTGFQLCSLIRKLNNPELD